MKCPECGFESQAGDERCFRCRAYLRQVDEGEVIPPRKGGSLAADLGWRVASAWREIEYRRGLQRLRLPRLAWNPLIPAFASLILPGSGQVLNRRPWKAAFFLGAYAVLMAVIYYQWYGSFRVSAPLWWAFLFHLASLPYAVTVIHTWIIFDAYNDCVRDLERRNVRVVESMVVSCAASLLVLLLFMGVRDIPAQRAQPFMMVNVPHLEAAGVRGGDTLLLDRRYYEGSPVLTGQIVENAAAGGYAFGGERTAGHIPAVVVALPGETVTLENGGFFNGGKRIYPVPAEWTATETRREFAVPPGRFLVMPGYALGGFPGFEPLLRTREALGGKFIMIIEPRERRTVLP